MLQITQQIADLANQLNLVELVTPVNRADIDQRFKSYHDGISRIEPYFCYQYPKLHHAVRLRQPLQELRQLLATELKHYSAITNDTEAKNIVVNRIILNRIDDALLTCDFANAILHSDNESASRFAIQKYGKPNRNIIELAYSTAERQNSNKSPSPHFSPDIIEQLSQKVFFAEDIRNIFDDVLRLYNINSWTTIIDDDTSAIDVRDRNSSGQPQIVIPSFRKVTGLKLLELIGHELECHLRSSENSIRFWQQNLTLDFWPLIPLLAKSDDESLYEGYAKLNDTIVSGFAAHPHPYYIIAIDLAMRGLTPCEVNEQLICLKTKQYPDLPIESILNSCQTITRRVFRGCPDSSSPNGFAFTKDSAYFIGYLKAVAFDPLAINFSSMTTNEISSLLNAGFQLEPSIEHQWFCLHPELLNKII